MRLVVRAAADNAVLATLQYWRSKPKTYRGKADAHGLYMRSFRIDKKAPLGKGSVRVTVTFAAKSSLTDVLPFTVVR